MNSWFFWGAGIALFLYVAFEVTRFMRPWWILAHQGKLFDHFIQEGQRIMEQRKNLEEKAKQEKTPQIIEVEKVRP